MLLPYVEADNIWKQVQSDKNFDNISSAWWGNANDVNLARATIPGYQCPSSNNEGASTGTMVIFSTYCGGSGGCGMTGYYFGNPFGDELGNTNYIGCAGGLGRVINTGWNNLRGIFLSREKSRFRDIVDGTSQTFMFGETVGENPRPTGPFVYNIGWFSIGGLPTAWGLPSGGRRWYTFGSDHPGSINYAFADGRVQSISENINGTVYRALSSMQAREVVGDY